MDKLNKEQREFDNLILKYYINNGFKELGTDKLKTFINIKFNSMSDAKETLNMTVADIRAHYFELQRQLYSAIAEAGKNTGEQTVVQHINIVNNIYGDIDNYNEYK